LALVDDEAARLQPVVEVVVRSPGRQPERGDRVGAERRGQDEAEAELREAGAQELRRGRVARDARAYPLFQELRQRLVQSIGELYGGRERDGAALLGLVVDGQREVERAPWVGREERHRLLAHQHEREPRE